MTETNLGSVLVVDDEPEMVGTLCRLLERHGYQATGRETGSEALGLLSEGEFDLLLTDLMMPGMDGLALMEMALQIDPQIVCVMMTGQATVQTAVDAMKLGAFDYITKPFKLAELLPVFSRATEMRRIRLENVQLRETVAMQQLTSAISLSLDWDTLLGQVADAALHHCDADEAAVLLYSSRSEALKVAAIRGTWAGAALGEEVPIDASLIGWLAGYQSRGQDPRDSTEVALLHVPGKPDGMGVRVPLVLGGQLIGAIQVTRKEGRRPIGAGRSKGLRILAGTASAALESARLVRQLRETNQKLERALEELQKTQQHIHEQARLRALGQMASGIAHDFNNALAPVLGFADLLVRLPHSREDPETLSRYLEYIRIGAEDAAAVVRRLREFYRGPDEGDDHLPVDLGQIVEQAVSLTQPKWKDQSQANGRTIQVQSILVPTPSILGDESQLRELLTNLIFNAVDAMPAGGTIQIRIFAEPAHVVLEVIDEGSGMTDEVRRHCLDPFFTTKGENGSGLGLSMVYGIVMRHHGRIEIESQLGSGTTFRIRFPTEGATDSGLPVVETSAPRQLHVLVVDDEAMVRNLVTTFLAEDGHTAETAGSAREALARFRAGQFDLVITDRAMPGGSGDQLALALREMDPMLPILLLTGFGDLMAARGECPDGVDVLLPKPISFDDLREAVSRALKKPGARPAPRDPLKPSHRSGQC